MSDEELELDLPETRTDFLRSLTMGVEEAKRQKLAAEKEMVAPGGRLGSGDAFTQILTSVLPVVMGAAIAGRRGGMVGAEAGQVANQGLFAAREKSEKEKQAAAKIKYQEASEAEKAALAKLSSGTEGMFKDERDEKNREAAAIRSDARYAESQKQAANTIAAAFERDAARQAATAKLQKNRQDHEQGKYRIPGAPILIDEATGDPYKVDGTEHKDASKLIGTYAGMQPYIDGIRGAIKNGDLQEQVSNFNELVNLLKDLRGYGGALTDSERILAAAGLPPIVDVSTEGVSRWVKGMAKGGRLEKVLNNFTRQLGMEVSTRARLKKYTIAPPPAYGTIREKDGKTYMATGTLGANLKPNFIEVSGDNS